MRTSKLTTVTALSLATSETASDPNGTRLPNLDVNDSRSSEVPPATTTYWRYVTSGWRNRRRKARGR